MSAENQHRPPPSPAPPVPMALAERIRALIADDTYQCFDCGLPLMPKDELLAIADALERVAGEMRRYRGIGGMYVQDQDALAWADLLSGRRT